MTPIFLPLTGLYEPSAILQLPDGRFLIVEDEKDYPFSLVSISAEGKVDSQPLTPGWLEADDGFWKLNDLEGLAIDRSGNVYAVTSQSLDGDGEQKKSREKLARFRIEDDRVLAAKSVRGLKPALTAAHPVLAAAARIADVKGDGGLNIEGLEFSPDQRCLLVGFRSPLLDNRAIVASILNPCGIFSDDEPPSVSAVLETLDLDGNGIRGMSYVPSLAGFLVIGGPVSRAQSQCRLWFWSGNRGDPARRASIPGLPGLDRAEGISPALIDGHERIIIVSDDGSREKKRYARFLLLDPDQLRISD